MSPHTVTLRFTTTPGLEDIVELDLRERLAAAPTAGRSTADHAFDEIELRPQGLDGHVLLHSTRPFEELRRVAFGLRSCFHVIRHVAFLPIAKVDPLETLTEDLAELAIDEMEKAKRFRVTSQRTGEHEFGSMDAQRVAGAALVERYGTAVDLEHFDTEVRVDAMGDTWLIGVQLTRDSLDKRYPWVYRPRVTLRTTVAYGMLRLAGIAPAPDDAAPNSGPTVLDPFCGSGTILIEAADIHPGIRCFGVDREPEAVEGAIANARAAGVDARIEVREGDARDIAAAYPVGSVDALVTNPPFGVRLGRRVNFTDLYRKLLAGAAQVVRPEGRIVVLVGKRRHAFNRAVRETGAVRIVTVRVIEIGGVYPAVFVLERS